MRDAVGSLLALLRIDRAAEPTPLAAALDASDTDELIRRAEQEGVSGLLYRDLRRAGLDNQLPAPALESLRRFYARTAALNLQRQQALGEVLRAAGHLDTNLVVLKGMALVETLYADPGTRPMTDIDLWAPCACEELAAVLEGLGYQAQPFYPDTFHRGAMTLEIHGDLIGAQRIRARRTIFGAEQAGMAVRTEPFAVGNERARRLDRCDTLLLACVHLLKHNACRLLWLIEVDALARRLDESDWATLIARAQNAGQANALRRVGFLLRDFLDGQTSVEEITPDGTAFPDCLTDGAGLGHLQRRALQQRRAKGALPVWAPLWFFSDERSFGRRTRSIFETLFPRPEVLRQIFEDRESWLATLYFRRFFQLLEMVVRR